MLFVMNILTCLISVMIPDIILIHIVHEDNIIFPHTHNISRDDVRSAIKKCKFELCGVVVELHHCLYPKEAVQYVN